MAVLHQALQAGRRKLLIQRPYLAHIAWALSPVPTENLTAMAGGAIAVDARWRLYFDPKAVESWSVDGAAGALYHEVMHILRRHAARLHNREQARANIAGDLEINDNLAAEGVVFPYPGVYPATFGLEDGLLAEQYYDLLPESECARSCGSAATGQRQPWEQPIDGTGSMDGVSEAEATLIIRHTAQAIQASASRGSVPAHLLRLAEAILSPQIDWRRVLAGAIRASLSDVSGAVDYSYRAVSRRAAVLPAVILPSLRQPVPNVAVVADTSGSMGERELAAVLGEVKGVLRSAGLRDGVRFIACDAAVHADRRIASAKQAAGALTGGGGTDMGRGIDAAVRGRPRPDVVIVLTDGYTPWPPEAPAGVKVIVGLIGAGDMPAPAWARTVKITTNLHEGA